MVGHTGQLRPFLSFKSHSSNFVLTTYLYNFIRQVVLWYLLYGFGLLLLILGAIYFWAAAHNPILIPCNQGLWLQEHPKVSTIIWTALGSILSAITTYLLQSMLVLVSQQILKKEGASLSTIECESKFSLPRSTGLITLKLY